MGRTLSHYRLEGEIGRGGMGVVYRATDTRLGRQVAVKMLPPDAMRDADRIRRFVHEARAASALNHPHIVTIHDIDDENGTAFLVMELVEGTPLDQVLTQGLLPVPRAVEWGVQLASALEVAHASAIVHRDIKPANIIITQDGRVKVLDFGLAKLIERAPSDATITAPGTRAGVILGTAAYMAPEQADGRPVDARADIFSTGAVLYEMLAGRRPFTGHSDLGVIGSILRDDPPPLRTVRPAVPERVAQIVARCLEKDPSRRFQDGGALRRELAAAQAEAVRPADPVWRRPSAMAAVVLVLLAVAGVSAWQVVQARRARWVSEEAIPEIERLQTGESPLTAYRRARDLQSYAPQEVERIRQGWYTFGLATKPDGADVLVAEYLKPDAGWEPIGRTPLAEVRLPFGYYRVRFEKAGFQPIEVAAHAAARRTIALPSDQAPPGMVFVPGGPFSVGIAGEVTLPDFWIDRLEVTNARFKAFVDAGGYRDPRFWKAALVEGARTLTFEEAMARFRDATGRPGPASWELGTFPDGRADHPVGGISWFEAAAFAEFEGRSLPTLHQWYRAAPPDEPSADILRFSNFDGKGPVRAGERPGVGPFGTVDMAGNVKEWCLNHARGTELRAILGGAWDEPTYRYTEDDAVSPWARKVTYGVRLVKNLGPVTSADGDIPRVYGDPAKEVPVGDEEFEQLKSWYAYDRTPLNDRVERVDDGSPHWRREIVTLDAAYGGERFAAQLFLPKTGAPPYQAIVLFPSAYALFTPSSDRLDLSRFEFIVRSGRAVLYPIYQDTFERRKPAITGVNARRDLHIQRAKDFFRAVDYLATRRDVDMNRLGYYSLSMGAYFGPIPVALEPRIRVAVFVAGGMRFGWPPQINPTNFMPRVKVPVLMINGKDDFQAPIEVQQRFHELLGTAPEHKVHKALDGGHVPMDSRDTIRLTLDWFDKYLGPVR